MKRFWKIFGITLGAIVGVLLVVDIHARTADTYRAASCGQVYHLPT